MVWKLTRSVAAFPDPISPPNLKSNMCPTFVDSTSLVPICNKEGPDGGVGDSHEGPLNNQGKPA
jgi:hypothetical protein